MRKQHKGKATTTLAPVSIRREPYHQREEYRVGDTAKKASIIRKALTLGHRVETMSGKKVTDARSSGGKLEICFEGKWDTIAPKFLHPGK